jgi:hypothetical protein
VRHCRGDRPVAPAWAGTGVCPYKFLCRSASANMPFVRSRLGRDCNGVLKHKISNIKNGCRSTCGMTALWLLTFIPIVSQPSRVRESGAGSPCCLSARMCEFMATPLSCARRGNPPQADAKRRGGFLGGTLSLPPKKGYEKL